MSARVEHIMAIDIAQDGDAMVIAFRGDCDGEAAAKLRAMCREALASCSRSVVVDFTDAREVTAIALASLVEEQYGSRIQVRGLSQRHKRLLRLLSAERAESIDDERHR